MAEGDWSSEEPNTPVIGLAAVDVPCALDLGGGDWPLIAQGLSVWPAPYRRWTALSGQEDPFPIRPGVCGGS